MTHSSRIGIKEKAGFKATSKQGGGSAPPPPPMRAGGCPRYPGGPLPMPPLAATYAAAQRHPTGHPGYPMGGGSGRPGYPPQRVRMMPVPQKRRGCW